ncbi:helix-hairpin-helix domain-containing protein [Pontixanthobacter gangjinensis]|uniref:Helix-hairpin-helix domain-containing protein n=1 Tax=Christiangramia aestuarii TaxID=1028746 RepID=A0A7M3SXR6_9FLAO|nr:helix-hairpin-helix domain-containing protein [Christiangramia aestuarii]MUP41397.1 helix-hairpin-helix domain-containing protein [Christiangramia aestuarii]
MKFLKSHFALSRSQQNGIFVLVALIIILQVLLLIDFPKEKPAASYTEDQLEAFRNELDSLNRAKPVIRDSIFPFNPNYLTDFKGYRLGMSPAEIDRLLAYRKEGRWINSANDFQHVTGISDSLLRKISPSFRFPEWVKEKERLQFQKRITEDKEIIHADLNIVSALDLKTINGVGEVLSERIVKYRSKIGGFVDPIQLYDVYGVSPEVIQRINTRFKLLSKPDVSIKNINEITEAELAEIPYFNERLAKDILNYRSLHERISSFEELSKINNFPYDKIDRIKLYLAIE